MSHAIQLAGVEYVPLHAVPYITDHYLNMDTLTSMISDPESYCTQDYDAILTASRVNARGSLVRPPYLSFQGKPKNVPLDVIVRVEMVREMFDMLVYEHGKNGHLGGRFPIWDLNAQLPLPLAQEIKKHVLSPLTRCTTRANSASAKLRALRSALARVVADAEKAGLLLDLNNLPGRKSDLLRILVRIDPSIHMAVDTFDSHYKKKLGLRWRQGSKPADATKLLALYGLSLMS